MADQKIFNIAQDCSTSGTIEFIPWTENQINNATASDITDYINKRMEEYEDENLYGGELHGYFVADFNKFDVKAFKKTAEPTRYLRDFLRKRNVFIQKSRGQSIPVALIDAVSNQWQSMPEDMINEVIEKYRPILNTAAPRTLKTIASPSQNSNNLVITFMKAFREEQKYAGMPLESFETHPSCSIACSTVADDTVATFVNRLRSNIATWKSQQNFTTEQYIELDESEAN
ncbi:hypothetical protein Golomagni_05136, partial [Golovinomyces magnicellulatus]